MIPFLDLYRQFKTIDVSINNAIEQTIVNSSYIGGDSVKEFENSYSEFLGINHTIGCANGTDAIEILLQAMGVQPGDEVIVPAISWISTSEAVTSVGATPIFVDVDPVYYTIDVDKIQSVISSKTTAIIPVHLYGQPVNMVRIMEIAKQNNLKVLEDCAQAHGSTFNGQLIGTFGDASSFSFYPGKNLGAYGDAGCMCTDNDDIARKARRIANHGQEGKHNHIEEGRNSRLDGLQASILSVKLPYLLDWIKGRNKVASQYLSGINNSNVIVPKTIDNGRHAYHLFVIRHSKRDELKSYLSDSGVSSAIHYPKALPFLECYNNRNFNESDFPVAARLQNEILSIPMFPELLDSEIDTIVSLINKF
tara:strand:+ start:2371 stop:3462 length:1092 start_codon:yes stop_codon:yes gene_type:complete